jgi:HSP20 family protein
VTRVEKLIGIGHREVIDADLSGYFDSIPHAELMRSVARHISDGAVLHLIKWWLVAPAYRKGALAPYREFPFLRSRTRDEFDRLWDRFSRVPNLWEGDTWRWGLEVEDEDGAVIVRAEAPGFEAGDFDVQVSDNRLVLRASRKAETKEKEGKAREYREQECYESVTLPPGIDKDKVEARYHNGILTLTLPKAAEAKAKRIAVKS